jgi:formylglycine-generating enzyme required for sulfatase activity/serine/threonine protein kinase
VEREVSIVIGREVGNYRIVKPMAEGGMGVVYLAEHTSIGKKAVVKFILKELLINSEAIGRFVNEAKALSRIDHPNIVEVLDAGVLQPDGLPYIIMKHLDGHTLADRIRALKVIPPPLAIDFAVQVTQALIAAHREGIVHRDLKPGNLFLVEDKLRPDHEQIKVLDFGIAKFSQGEEQQLVHTRTGMPMGSPPYMSPEQCEGSKSLDHRSDIYSLGVILYEMLCGAPPFAAEGWGMLLSMHMKDPPVPPRQRDPGISEKLERIVLRALEKDPAKRYQTAKEFQQALLEVSQPRRKSPPSSIEMGHSARVVGWALFVTLLAGLGTLAVSTIPKCRNRGVSQVNTGHQTRQLVLVHDSGQKVDVGRDAEKLEIAMPPPAAKKLEVEVKPDPGTTVTLSPSAVPTPAPKCAANQVAIPGGTFTMGDNHLDSDSRPEHQVTLSPYCIDKTEVTVAAYRKCVDNGKCDKPEKPHPYCIYDKEGLDKHPMNCVTWFEAKKYCQIIGGRLPTEAEWEFAARGTDGRKYPWGNQAPTSSRLNWSGKEDGWEFTAPVGSYPSDKSPFGALDMAGNVWEWTADSFSRYSMENSTNPHRSGSLASLRVNRGGGWSSDDPSRVRAASRGRDDPGFRLDNLGFRCARGAKM